MSEAKVLPQDGGCWYCHRRTTNMVFSVEFDTNLHIECLKRQHFADPQDQEAAIMACEFGLAPDPAKPVVFFDMDGVACNFVKGALKAFGYDYKSNIREWPERVYSVATVMGRTEEQMWSVLDEFGEKFWIDLEEYEHFRTLYDAVSAFAEVHFLTVPAWHPGSAAGKLHWLQKRFGESFGNYNLTRHKYFCAAPGRVLVDDSPHHCREFLKRGGGAVLIEQPWNRMDRGDGLVHRAYGQGTDVIVKVIREQLREHAPV